MILETLTVAGGLLLFLILFRVPVCRRTAGPAPVLRLSILIPARNEEAALPRLLDSIRRQDFRPFEVVVVDDGSTDRTTAVAVEWGAAVLTSAPLPEGWRGKTWACWQGARAARGDVFLFLDADTFFFEGGLRRLVDSWRAGGGAVSAGPYQVMERPYERLSAFFALVMTAAMGAFTVAGRRVTGAGLFGPCLMVERAAYFQAGGHEGQKGRILEHFFMAARFAEIGVPVRCFGGRECLGVRLYPGGWRDLAAGWTKAFAAGAGQTAPWLLAVIVAWLSAAMLAALLPVLRLVTAGPGAAAWAAGACLWFAIIIRWALGRIGNYGWVAAFLFPVPLLFFMVVFSRSLFRQLTGRSVQWKGRTIVAGKEGGQ